MPLEGKQLIKHRNALFSNEKGILMIFSRGIWNANKIS